MKSPPRQTAYKLGLFVVLLLAVYLTSWYSYALLHTIIELLSIAIAGAIFALVSNFRRFYENSFLEFIAAGYLACSVIDLLHTLSYRGMTIITGYDSNLPTQLWIAARYLQAATLLAAPFFLRRKVRFEALLAGFGLVTGLLLLAIFAWDIFPTAYVEGQGLTLFKIYSEYLIDLLLLAAMAHLWSCRSLLDRRVLNWIMLSISITIVSELAFTFYIDVYSLSNLVGHFAKLISYYLVYKAIVETGARIIYADMAALRETKAALLLSQLQARRSLAELSSIYATTPVGLCSFDNQLRYQAINDMLAGINQLPAADHIGKTIYEVLPPPITRPIERALRQVLETGRPVLNQPLSGSFGAPEDIRYWLASYHPVTDENGAIQGVSSVVQDVTEKRRAEEALQSSERTLKLFIEFAPTAIAMLDCNMRYISYSRRYLADYRLPMMDITGRSHYEIFPEIPERWKEIHRRCLAGAIEKADEDPFPRADGGLDWVRWEIRPWYQRGGEIGGLILFSEVITDRKRAEQELSQAHEKLQGYTQRLAESNRELEQFAFVASHDLQEPLQKIRMFGDLLQSRLARLPLGPDCDESVDAVRRMQSATTRMQTMINGLLELSRVSTRREPFKETQLLLVAEDVVADMEARLRHDGGQIILGDLPAAEVDVLQIRRLFMNLFSNALKFHKPGQPPVVEMTGAAENGRVTITIKDNGIGFDEQYTERIFQPFQRLHGRSEYEGTGLGLSICRKIVERHHGTIQARSHPGEGAEFIITLPREQAQ